jgi:hypothetical protein
MNPGAGPDFGRSRSGIVGDEMEDAYAADGSMVGQAFGEGSGRGPGGFLPATGRGPLGSRARGGHGHTQMAAPDASESAAALAEAARLAEDAKLKEDEEKIAAGNDPYVNYRVTSSVWELGTIPERPPRPVDIAFLEKEVGAAM